MLGLVVLILVEELEIEKKNLDREKDFQPLLATPLYNHCS